MQLKPDATATDLAGKHHPTENRRLGDAVAHTAPDAYPISGAVT